MAVKTLGTLGVRICIGEIMATPHGSTVVDFFQAKNAKKSKWGMNIQHRKNTEPKYCYAELRSMRLLSRKQRKRTEAIRVVPVFSFLCY